METGGTAHHLDEPFVDGMTLGEYLALSDEAQQKLWDKWHAEAWEQVEKQYPRGVDVKAHPVGQECGTQVGHGNGK